MTIFRRRSHRRPWGGEGSFARTSVGSRYLRPGLSLRVIVLLLIAAGITGWLVGRMGAVPQRPSTILSVYRHDLDKTVSMDLEEYVKGVVAAEMPASFHVEALKAQAVAARTLALRLWRAQSPLPDHPDAVISTDYRTHQAWISEAALRERWGSSFEYYWHWSKITRAVAATRGLALAHNGELIFPAYHASSGGRTEDSENYWTSYTPYLRSVEDPYAAGSKHAETVTAIPKSRIAEAGGVSVAAGAEARLVEVTSRFPGGRVQWVRVGDERMTGRQLREALGLRSNWFDVEDRGEEILFTVRGYGHGVGLSQYGADGMAQAGFTFDQILRHYYTGVDIITWYD